MPSLFVGYHSNIAIVCAKFNALRPLLCCLPFIIILFSIFHTFLFTDFYYIFTLLTYIFVHLLFNRNKINREKSSSRTHIGIGWMWEVNRHTHTHTRRVDSRFCTNKCVQFDFFIFELPPHVSPDMALCSRGTRCRMVSTVYCGTI